MVAEKINAINRSQKKSPVSPVDRSQNKSLISSGVTGKKKREFRQ